MSRLLVSLENQAERDPSWAERQPVDFNHLRGGVLYRGLNSDTLTQFMQQPTFTARLILAAVGRDIHWGRADGPWVAWDAQLQDENTSCKVIEREWPWCWGDGIWVAGTWQDIAFPVALHFDHTPPDGVYPQDCGMYVGTESGQRAYARMSNDVYDWAAHMTDGHAYSHPLVPGLLKLGSGLNRAHNK